MSISTSLSGPTRLLAKALLSAIPLLLLPTALLALFYNYAALILVPQNNLRHRVRRSSRFKPLTIIITASSTPEGLRLARAFYQTGHNVVGVEWDGLFRPARWSKAISRYHKVRSPVTKSTAAYIEDLLRVVERESADLWIDCAAAATASTQARARRVIEMRSSCACLSADTELYDNFTTRQEFQAYTKRLGLASIESYNVTTRHEVHDILNESRGKKFILSTSDKGPAPQKRAILPRRTMSQTYHDISQLKPSKSEPWVLEEYLGGVPKYSAFCLVVNGTIKAFSVGYQSDSKNGFRPVPSTSGLYHAMRDYTDDFVKQIGGHFSTPLSIDFCVGEKASKSGVVQQILPVEGHLAVCPAVLLFAGKNGSIALTKAYTSMLAPTSNGLGSYTGLPYDECREDVIEPNMVEPGVFYLGDDLKSLTATTTQFLTRRSGFRNICTSYVALLNHLISWREGLYAFWDPLPAFYFYLFIAPYGISLETVEKQTANSGHLLGRKQQVNGT